jgi:hypothetical protein
MPRRRLADEAVRPDRHLQPEDRSWVMRFPFDIPIEDFGFGFTMITVVLMLWQRTLNHRAEEAP